MREGDVQVDLHLFSAVPVNNQGRVEGTSGPVKELDGDQEEDEEGGDERH